jgi:hypothetical protein
MNTVQFLSPNLKYNNNSIYYLNFNELNNKNYKKDNYFIILDENKVKNTITINSNEITYKIITSLFDENIVIEMNYNIELNKEELLKYFYYIQEYIKDIENIKNIEDTYLKEYYDNQESNYLKYINNLVIV